MKLKSDIKLDIHQQKVAVALQALEDTLDKAFSSNVRTFIDRFIYRKPNIKGIYIHGSVGRGKTMLMDSFYASVSVTQKERWHFHEFMQNVHKQLKSISLRKNGSSGDDQPIDILATEISRKIRLLCFDEFHVTDIADAMILGRLFKKFFQLGIVVVATSNQHPDELYAGGLHRERFLPFIEILKENVPEIELDGPIDYRRAILKQHKRYFSPINKEATQAIDKIFTQLREENTVKSHDLKVNGRTLYIPQASNGVARLTYSELCDKPLGAADYLCIADNFHTILLENVPIMDANKLNEARRFITLIDILYDRNINLIISAEAEPDQLYHSNLFLRTASRLVEMTA